MSLEVTVRARHFLFAFPLTAAVLSAQTSGGSARPMTHLDVQQMRQIGSPTPSPNGKWLLYTVSVPDWKEARRQTDTLLVSLERGVPSTRQLTFTKDKNETSPQWSRDGLFFAFLSNRDAPAREAGSTGGGGGGGGAAGNQLYVMQPDGGEARKVTDAKEGISNYAFSPDGKWVVYRSGKSGEEQLHRLPVAGVDSARTKQLTRQIAGVGTWRWAPNSKRIYFATADTVDPEEKARTEKRFTVVIRNPDTPRSSLWALDPDAATTTRLTRDSTISVTDFVVSPDGAWIGFRGVAADRHKRNITEQGINADLYLLQTATGRIERLTNNREVAEGAPHFSPDSRLIAFSAPSILTQYSMSNNRVYLRRVDDTGGQWRKLGAAFDGDVSIGFWSADGKTIYFNEGVRATNQVLALDVERDVVRPVTDLAASVSVNRDEDTGVLLVTYADPRTPSTWYSVTSPEQLRDRASWRQLTDANPQVKGFALGDEEELTWTSRDGRKVAGVLVKPVGYREGQRYPLIVALHGGPAAADVLGFNGGYSAQVYAGAGWMVLRPNYRGSTNYGEVHKTAIVGDYFRKGYEDIMTGVDHLIQRGMVDPGKMGVLGWSAGGHWANWILTHTDRFKAISSGAGTANWISMYAQSDVQRNRQFYLGNKLPYDDFDAYWNQSPLKYIRNAKTPTMIHVVKGDPRVPSPQSEELHMALKKIGVPTELYVYPGESHGIPDARNQYLKGVAEKAWMDYWVLGSGKKFAWRDVLKSLEDPEQRPSATDRIVPE